ncbi:hypothetical protein SAMN05421736_108141 [Evansella caseinilytica]|uniref:Uncharacterized protein n=1 Tax=Evansella caseinilytica TaxID=1503961 RepID=A0A1H3RJK5_9BACI|nr:hypothetical protein [Evansella caseinilytica]SDZ25942.1 hypothetical protein SAMN05421736_108141 [Evansella caseinilytica]
MELISVGLGFVIAIILYSLFGSTQKYGSSGCILTFMVYWAIGAVCSFFIFLIAGFLIKWVVIILIILFLVSRFKSR